MRTVLVLIVILHSGVFKPGVRAYVPLVVGLGLGLQQ